MEPGVRATMMRGGTSKGLYFVADDLPSDEAERDSLVLRAMGSPDDRQIDGVGGAHPLTSKVAIVSRSERSDADVDYLFLQLGVGSDLVTDKQNCGNLLAGVAAFAIERGLVAAGEPTTEVRIYMRNTDGVALARIETPGRQPTYHGSTEISGVPGGAAPVKLFFEGTAGSTCGALLPTGNPSDTLRTADGREIHVTCIDNGMPTVVVLAAELGIDGGEEPAELEANTDLRVVIEELRLAAGQKMGLGDVAALTIPKMTIASPPGASGVIRTRTFIPHRCHDAIGVLGAVSVASACVLEGAPVAALAAVSDSSAPITLEHPTGVFDCVLEVDDSGALGRAGVVRTARKLFDGMVFPREDL